MDSAAPQSAAVYKRSIGYTDEHLVVNINRDLEALLERWRSGEATDFGQALAKWNSESESPEVAVSTHSTIAEAEDAAQLVHAEAMQEFPFVGFGFFAFGCEPAYYPYEDQEPSGVFPEDRDMGLLRQWCKDNDVTMPELDPSTPGLKETCREIAHRTLEGELWLDMIEDGADGAAPFAADLVALSLHESGRSHLVPDLFAHIVCPLAYVGPAPEAGAKPPEPPYQPKGFFGRLFRR